MGGVGLSSTASLVHLCLPPSRHHCSMPILSRSCFQPQDPSIWQTQCQKEDPPHIARAEAPWYDVLATPERAGGF